MIIKNQEIINIYRTLQEITGNTKAKEELPESGPIIYAMMRTYNHLTPAIKKLVEEETKIRESEKIAGPDPEVSKKVKEDIKELYDREEHDVLIHKISLENFYILQKYLSGPSTITLSNFMTAGPNLHEVKEPKPKLAS